ncbi:MAG: macro domain-containing protein [Promethearchaeota archaeon]
MEQSININQATLEILLHELHDACSDAIVIPSNSRLMPSGTLRCNVLKKAGAKVQIECNRIINKISTIPVGGAVITSAGELPSKYIIHANNSSRDKKSLMKATWNSLKAANKKKFENIVFCALSKDMQGFTMKACAKIMILTIKKYLAEQNRSLKKVCICLENEKDYKDFEKILNE